MHQSVHMVPCWVYLLATLSSAVVAVLFQLNLKRQNNFPSCAQCDSSSADSTAGYLVVASIVQMSQMLQLL